MGIISVRYSKPRRHRVDEMLKSLETRRVGNTKAPWFHATPFTILKKIGFELIGQIKQKKNRCSR
jgi:hypothetical protein